MKKLLLFLVTCILLSSASLATPVVYEKPDIDIFVDGSKIAVTDVPIIVNSRTLIPLRNLLVALGVPDNDENIQWIPDKRQVKVFYNDVVIQLEIDSGTAYINNKATKLDSAATIHNSRTYLPAKFVGEALGYSVFWDPYNPAVLVTKKENYEFNSEVLNTMKTSMENATDYQAEFAAETLITVSNSNFEESKKKVINEKVDFGSKLMEVSTLYNSGETTGTLEYYSDYAKYYNRDYANGFPSSSWQVSSYNPKTSDKTPYEAKEKLMGFQIDESLYGMMECLSSEETYCLYSISNNEALLKCFADAGLYFETVDGNGTMKDMRIVMYIEKDFLLPTKIKIETTREITGSEKYGVENVVTENSVFYLTVSYDQGVMVNLPQ